MFLVEFIKQVTRLAREHYREVERGLQVYEARIKELEKELEEQ